MALVGSREVAAAFNVTTRRVEQLAAEEGMPRAGRGRYDLGACMVWYIRFLQKALNAKAGEGDSASPWRQQRLRLAKADAELKEIEVARRRGELIAVDEAARIWEEAYSQVRARMIAAIASHAPRAVNVPNVKQASAMLTAVVDDALSAAASVAAEMDGGDVAGDRGRR